MSGHYIHGSSMTERQRLALMNDLINRGCLEALALENESQVLDVGAGTGQFTHMMASQLPSGSRIIAVERDPDQVRAAREMLDQGPDRCAVEFRVGDALDLPLAEAEMGMMDLAHSRFLLEHVQDPAGVVRAMVAAVRPGGRIVLLDDDHELMRFWPEPEGLMAAWKAYYRTYSDHGNDPLVGRKLASLLQQAGALPSRITQLFYGGCAGMDSFPGAVDNLVGVLSGARSAVLSGGEITAQEYDTALDRFRRFKSLPDAAVWYVINWAEGRVRENPF